MQLLGWGADKAGPKYWIAENSWGPLWGENQFFQPCSVTNCQDASCQDSDKFNPDCIDSPIWKDEFGNGCDWYASNDKGCLIHPNSGQLSQCRRACSNCRPEPPRNGEMCGYFRMQRGQNRLGIESFASHTYVAGHAPLEGIAADIASTCGDDPSWRDYLNKDCYWYRVNDPGCMKFQDVGQRAFCRQTCVTCPDDVIKFKAPATLMQDSGCKADACPTFWLFLLCLAIANSLGRYF